MKLITSLCTSFAIAVGATGVGCDIGNDVGGDPAPEPEGETAVRGPHAIPAGPLRVSSANPRYFTDGSGKAIYLAGLEEGFELQDDAWGGFQFGTTHVASDFARHLDVLGDYHHNVLRLWAVETSAWDKNPTVVVDPVPYVRGSDGRFDLDRFNPEYFARLRDRVDQARRRGIYVIVMLFEGFSSAHPVVNTGPHRGARPWFGHPFNAANNRNNVDADVDNDGDGTEFHSLRSAEVVRRQKAYVRKVIDTVNDLDNVIYEIANESIIESKPWQYEMIRTIKSYEANKPNQHPVLMSASWSPGVNQHDSDLLDSPADAIAPSIADHDYKNNPPAATGKKVVIADSDHISWTSNDPNFVWVNFLRGNNSVTFDWNLVPFDWNTGRKVADDGSWNNRRRAIGQTVYLAERMNLAAMTPQGGLSSTGYCLANSGTEYLVYQPKSGDFTVEVAPGTYAVEWIGPTDTPGKVASRTTVSVDGGKTTFSPSGSGPAVLHLRSTTATTISTRPTASSDNAVSPRDTISATVTGGSTVGDWVAIYRASDPAESGSWENVIAWQYLNGSRDFPSDPLARATLDFTAPATRGDYEFRFFSNNSNRLLATTEFTVR